MAKRFISILTVVIMLSMLCSCKAGDRIKNIFSFAMQANDTATDNTEVVSEKPNIINAGVYDFDTFNPLVTQSQSVKEAMQFVYEPLFSLDDEMRTVPVLAKDFSVSPDGKRIVINLRDDVMWHDGTKFGAEDVAYTIKCIRNGQTSYTDALYNVRDYLMTDDYSIRLDLNYSVPSYESLLTFPIVKYGSDMTVNPSYVPNGTGAFCYGTKASTDTYYFGAFENYHDGRAKIDALYVNMLDSYEDYLNMLEVSEIDFSSNKIINLTEYMPKGNVKINNYPQNDMVFWGFNTSSSVLSGNLTRQALSKLIDKGELVETIIFSHGKPSDIPINPNSYLYTDTKTDFKVDDVGANDCLGDDGWGPDADGTYVRQSGDNYEKLEFEILVNADNKEHTQVAEALADNLMDFGITATINALAYDAYLARIESNNYDTFIGEIMLDNNMDLSPLTRAENNYFAYSSETLDTLCAQIGMTRNEDEVKELFSRYCETLLNDMPFATLYFKDGALLSTSNVVSGIAPVSGMIYRNCANWSIRK